MALAGLPATTTDPKPAVWLALLWILKSKFTPMRLEEIVGKGYEADLDGHLQIRMRRNCSRRSTISSWTSWVWLTTMLRLVSNG